MEDSRLLTLNTLQSRSPLPQQSSLRKHLIVTGWMHHRQQPLHSYYFSLIEYQMVLLNGLRHLIGDFKTGAMRTPKFTKLLLVMEIRRVKVFVHWSVLLISAFILLGAVEDPLLASALLTSYYGVILLHECGHMIAAQRKGCIVSSIELYPIWGITRFSEPYSRLDHCVIAWGGVLAKLTFAVPLIFIAETFGYSRFQSLNAIIAILCFFSLAVAVFNLLPIRPLDGVIAWSLLPSPFKRPTVRPTKREPGWRSWR